MNKKNKLELFLEQNTKWVYFISGIVIAILVMPLFWGLRNLNFANF